ncbi:adenylate kinase family enzyme [Motilibacter rhizosphaerae]|uniref:Adenylate kinase family enzyme n=1 Tax=Motilibacter rhizosphaerae TaxID=598652 RepID=A0A4Q7N7B6_9ACTN|nr:hypothetical protein [Motilibacter rhizosphaerae]RZS77900.1 adenylate kinase family enzyme [Motilibacter rhizosphaerae]
MPLLGPTDPLPARPRRVLIAGTSGFGKSTLARRVSGTLGIPYVEIDALYHGPGWTPRPTFEHDVRSFSSKPAWTTEWQYDAVRAHLAAAADLVIWLDLPRVLVMRQVIDRTLRRRLRRLELWNGNVEPPLSTILTDREHIVRWAWTTHHKTAPRIHALMQERPDLAVVRLTSHGNADRWIRGPLSATAQPA